MRCASCGCSFFLEMCSLLFQILFHLNKLWTTSLKLVLTSERRFWWYIIWGSSFSGWGELPFLIETSVEKSCARSQVFFFYARIKGVQVYAILSEDVLSLTSNSLPFLHIGNYYFYNLSHLLVSILVICSSPGGFQPVLRILLFGQRDIFLCEDGEKRSQVFVGVLAAELLAVEFG